MPERTEIFPFKRRLSFDGLVDFWRGLASNESSTKARFAGRLIEQVEEIEELRGPVEDLSILERHSDLLSELLSAAFPYARWEDWVMGAILPFKLETIYATPSYRRLGLDRPESWFDNMMAMGSRLTPEEMDHGKSMNAYHVILKKFYGADAGFIFPMVYQYQEEESKLEQFYKIHIDTRFVECVVKGDLPELDAETLETLMNHPMDLDLWKSHLPPELFSFQGFAIVTLVDVTTNEVHSLLKNTLLQKSALTSVETIEVIETHLRSLIRVPDLRIGIIGITSDSFEAMPKAKTVGRSLLMADGELPQCPSKDKSVYAEIFKVHEPVVVSNLESCEYCTGFEHKLREQNFRSLIVAPLMHNGRIIGLLELASEVANELTSFHRVQLMEVFSLFSSAMKRSLDEYEDRLAAIVKRQFTSIHPAVEWRFRQAAEKYLIAEQNNSPIEFEPIVFNDVYPLYGLSDIRNSSVSRNEAIQDDLLEQLGLALNVIVEASSQRPMPALDELGFRIGSFAGSLESGLTSDTEVNAIQFLKNDVEPLFHKLASFGPKVQEKIEAYKDKIDPQLGVLYNRRRDYETSVTMINDTIASFLDRQDAHAQRMFPHFFEKYKTDGVDYNIYVGDAIANGMEFDLLYLRNMRLWQLITMCGIVWELEAIAEYLPAPLSVAHLVLVQDVPISVRFRQDEKKFDVDGAYNARYEIVKKRIDKAEEKHSGVRITQPGHLSIVYSQAGEGREYRRYLEYLQAAGYVEAEPEELELEDLQGVNGLRALRVKVGPQAPDMEVRARPEVVLSQFPHPEKIRES